MIFSPASSYTGRDAPFPGLTPSHSSSNSPSASRTSDARPLPRPRPLHLNKKLSILAKEDAVAYSLFVEGITLLAWDIAWLCRTQGVDIGAKSWDEVCAMGKNLWQLLVAPPPAGEPANVGNPHKDGDEQKATKASENTSSEQESKDTARLVPMFGHYSHGTAHSLLAAAEGTDFMRGWRLHSHLKVIEKVKAMLLSERTGAEWEVLEDKEWEEEAPQTHHADLSTTPMEETVLVKGSEPTEMGADEAAGTGRDEKGKGTSGWTKLKSRSGT